MRWPISNRTREERSRREFRNNTQGIRLIDRIDTVLIFGLFTVGAVLVGFWASIILISDQRGLFDAPPMQPMVDERLLINVYDDLSTNPLLDVIVHAPDNHVYIAQAGGIVHRYDPRTHLWSSETPFAADEPIDPDLVMLRSGCGADLYSDNQDACPDPNSIWAISADGSLARRRAGDWEIIVNNTSFIGADGSPVQNDEMTAAAVSSDNQWLLVGTTNNGIGVYHIDRREWINPGAQVMGRLPSPTITQLVWWQGDFWIGTPAGAGRLTIDGEKFTFVVNDQVNGRILDMDGDDSGTLWFLEERACVSQGEQCLRLGNYTSPGQVSPTIVIDQRNHFQSLNLTDLQYAQMWQGRLLLAGQAGIYTYDSQLHAWDQLFSEEVLTTLPRVDDTGFYFTFENGIGQVHEGELANTWEFSNETILKLLHGDNNELLALTQEGNLFAISTTTGEFEAIYQVGSTAYDPASFTAAVSLGDTLFFTRPDGVLLHNTRTRTYQDIPQDTVPAWLLAADTRFIKAGDDVFVVSGLAGNNVAVYTIPINDMTDSSFYIGGFVEELSPVMIQGPITKVWQWGTKGIGMLGGDGNIYQFTTEGRGQITDSAAEFSGTPTVRDVAQQGDTAIFLVDETLGEYNLTARQWRILNNPLDDGAEDITALIWSDDSNLLLQTNQGRLLQLNGRSLIGDVEGFGISDDGLTDAWLEGDILYLGGNGRVEAYSFDDRKIVNRWVIDNGGTVTIKAIINDVPLIQIGSQVALGDTIIDAGAGNVISVSVDDNMIWTVRRQNGQLYLKGHTLNAPNNQQQAICFFRTPQAGNAVTTIYDAKELPNGAIAVATNDGLRFYNPQARSWYTAPANTLPADRLYTLPGQLLLVQGEEVGSSFQLQFIDLNSIRLPHSCSLDPVTLQASDQVAATSVAVNEQLGRIAWLETSGAVEEWQDDSSKTLLEAGATPPTQNQLRGVYDFTSSGLLLFTTDSAIWQYDLLQRFWTRIPFDFPGNVGSLSNINIETQGGINLVTARTESNDFFMGTFELTDSEISMELIYRGNQGFFNSSANDLLDVQLRQDDDGMWTFVLRDQIKYFDPEARLWSESPRFSENIQSFEEAFGRGVVVPIGGRSWYIADDTSATPSTFIPYELDLSDQARALDDDGNVWRLTAAGEVVACAQGSTDYSCAVVQQPFLLNPDAVLQTFTWQDHVLFAFTEGVRAFISGQETTLPSEITQFTDITASLVYEEKLILYSSSNERILLIDEQLDPDFFDEVEYFILDDEGRPWAQSNGIWHYYEDGSFQMPTTVAGRPITEAGITVFALSETPVSGIDAAGIPYRWENEHLQPGVPLPDEIDVNDVQLLVPSGIQWGVLTANQIHIVEQGSCIVESATPTAVPTNTPSPINLPTPIGSPTPTPANSPTPTATATALPTPTPTSTPIQEPCLIAVANLSVPNIEAVKAYWQDEALIIVALSGQVTTISRDNAGNYAAQTAANPTMIPMQLSANNWPLNQTYLERLPNGQTAYNPVMNLEINGQGQLIARRSSGPFDLLAARGVVPVQLMRPFTSPAALNVGWLRWDRETDSFVVNTSAGTQSFSKQDFIVGNQLLFERTEALLARSAADVYTANEYGIWHYPNSDLNLSDAITYYPADLQTPIRATHNQILANAQAVNVNQIGLSIAAAVDPAISIGDVVFTERVRFRRVEATVTINNNNEDAFTNDGLLWDVNRRGLAYEGGRLLLLSDAGIHPVLQLEAFDPGPNNLGRAGGILQGDANGEVYLFDVEGSRWYQYDNAAWQSNVSNPHQNRIFFNNISWQWSVQNDNLLINLHDSTPYNFSFSTNGFRFTSDQLLAATSWRNKLLVATEAFLEIESQSGEFISRTAVHAAPISPGRFQQFQRPGGSSELFFYTDTSLLRWDDQTNQLTPFNGPDPEQNRPLVDGERLRFTLQANTVTKEILVNQFNGTDDWIPFSFVTRSGQRQFPFDYVTSATIYDSLLYVGTEAGLAVYASPENTQWKGLQAFYHVDDMVAGNLVPVERIGVPESRPDRLMVRSAAYCVERIGPQPFQVCRDAAQLDRRLRISNSLWQWLDVAGQGISGQYRDANSQLAGKAIQINGGRLPHDRITDAVVCNNQAFTQWEDTWISTQRQDTFAIDTNTNNYFFVQGGLKRFICIDQIIPLTREITLNQGIYVEGNNAQIWQFTNGQWIQVTDQVSIEGIIDYANNPPALYGQRMRLLTPQAGNASLIFEQRGLDDSWREIPWQFDNRLQGWRVAIDSWQELIYADGQLWAATPAGLVSVERLGQTYTDVDSLVVIREPAVDGQPCLVTDLMQEGNITYARCNYSSNQVFEGVLSKHADQNVFTAVPDFDPIAQQTLLSSDETGYWSWQRVERIGGRPGVLEGIFLDEPIQLLNGRFAFDTINSIALFEEEVLEIGTSVGGWYQSPRNTLTVSALVRPSTRVESTIVGVSLTKANESFSLCLQTDNDTYVRLARDNTQESVESCPAYLGADGLWEYYTDANQQLRIIAPDSIGGRGERRLLDGRFTDNIIIGLPVTGTADDLLRYWLPSQSGILELDAQLRTIALHAGSFAGLPADETPIALFVLDHTTPTYVGNDGLYSLGNTRELLVANLFNSLPGNAKIINIHDGYGNFVRAHSLNEAGQKEWQSIVLNDATSVGNGLIINVSTFEKFIERQIEWGQPAPQITVYIRSDRVSFQSNTSEVYEIALPPNFNLVDAILYDTRILLIGKQDLLDIDLESVMEIIFTELRS